MQLKQRTKTALAILGVAMLLAVALVGLWAAQQAQGAALKATPHARAPRAEELSPEAAADPLVAALWDKAQFYDGTAFAQETYQSLSALENPGARAAALQQLGELGVLPAAACGYTVENAQGVGGAFQVAAVFTQYDNVLLYDGTRAVAAGVGLPGGPADGFDLGAAAESFVRYLELDGLGDWRAVELFAARGTKDATLYSDGAQLVAQVVEDTRGGGANYRCTVLPVARGAMALMEIGP